MFAPNLFAADITTDVSTSQIIEALGIQSNQVVSITTNGTSSAAIGVADTSVLGIIENPQSGNDLSLLFSNSFPTEGREFLLISTGDASLAGEANGSDSLSTTLDGLNAPGDNGGQDMAQIEMVLEAPESARCASFDFSFFSDEYNEYIGSNYNDTFLIEKGESNFVINNNSGTLEVDAPNNFAFDTADNVISVNSSFNTVCDTAADTPGGCDTGSVYDNATIKLRASTPVSGGEEVTFIISIMDLGDSVYDSTAFIDKFLWSTEDCSSGAQEIEDADSDGLLDDWETFGVTVELPGGGTEFVNLPAMGADPNVKDLFIELDWMEEAGVITYRPIPEVLDKVIAAYAALGINVHIDAGADSIMNPDTGETWAEAGITSESNNVGLISTLGSSSSGQYNWSAFDELKEDHFPVSRRNIFHYGIIGHNSPFSGVSAISRSLNASDFFVPMGSFLGTVNELAGSILRATGANLALRDGGRDNTRFKPHYFSVMNPLYAMDGLILDGVDGNMLFSTVDVDDLNEASLSEGTGLPTTDTMQVIGVKYACSDEFVIAVDTEESVDWNCSGSIAGSVSNDINNSGSAEDVLETYTDLASMKFAGGLIGEPNALITLPTLTEVSGYKQETPVSTFVPSGYEVSVVMPSYREISGTYNQEFVIRNRGSQDETFTVTATSSEGWADFSGLSDSYTIAAGERVELSFPVSVPAGTVDTDEIRLVVTSSTHSTVYDIAETYVDATTATSGPGATNIVILYEDGNPFVVVGAGSIHWIVLAGLSMLLCLRRLGSFSSVQPNRGNN
ncbi:choice-of-anchor L domain-containing protein [Hahella ganghwensis]|uniref:choice-of-anchor L domain-containing protein n=1 Tax=Hahella ganghwensis TaxID=286420 RepID=UPI00036CFF5D|nr:choice-of-anchor L domain-containing protein [Hahella ganghwensis]